MTDIGNLAREVDDLKSQLIDKTDTIPLSRTFTDNIKIVTSPLKIEIGSIASQAFMLGHSTNGILGTNRLGNSGDLALIWGSTSYGVWGTNEWSDSSITSAGYSTYKIINANNQVNEYFLHTDFIDDTNTTATVSDGVSFSSGDVLYSDLVYYDTNNINVINMEVDDDTNLTLYVSIDNGSNWIEVDNGSDYELTTTGNQLKYKITASGTASIKKVVIKYTFE